MPEIIERPPYNECHICGAIGQNLQLIQPWVDGGWMFEEERRVCYDCAQQRLEDELIRCVECDALGWYQELAHDIVLQWPNAIQYCRECRTKHIAEVPPQPIQYCARCACIGIAEQFNEDGLCRMCAREYRKCKGCDGGFYNKNGVILMTFYQKNPLKAREVQVENQCKECMAQRYPKCQHCNCFFESPADMDHDGCCLKCASKLRICDVCHERAFKDEGCKANMFDGTKGWACGKCARWVRECDRCGEYAIYVGTKYHQHHDRHWCCAQCQEGWPIQPYNFKRPPVFYGEGDLFYGIENEFDFKQGEYMRYTDYLRAWCFEGERKNLFHLTHDGTLKYGVELVSMPMTFDYWAQQKEEFIFPHEVPNRVEMKTAGCHIHMSKDAFQVAHLHKFMVFLNNHFENFMRIFGRGIENYCRECLIDYEQFAEAQQEAQYNRDDKYWWINMKGGKTIEIRVFRAATNWVELQSYLQLLDSVYHYTKDRAPADMDWKEYYRFISKEDKYFILADCLEKNPPIKGKIPIKAEDMAKGQLRQPKKKKDIHEYMERVLNVQPPNYFEQWYGRAAAHEPVRLIVDEFDAN